MKKRNGDRPALHRKSRRGGENCFRVGSLTKGGEAKNLLPKKLMRLVGKEHMGCDEKPLSLLVSGKY